MHACFDPDGFHYTDSGHPQMRTDATESRRACADCIDSTLQRQLDLARAYSNFAKGILYASGIDPDDSADYHPDVDRAASAELQRLMWRKP